MDEENAGVVTLGPGTSSETETFRPRTHDDLQDHQEDEQSQNRNEDGAERMFNMFEGQWPIMVCIKQKIMKIHTRWVQDLIVYRVTIYRVVVPQISTVT